MKMRCRIKPRMHLNIYAIVVKNIYIYLTYCTEENKVDNLVSHDVEL
jgi:hypothetical protein